MVGGVERYYQVAKCFRDEDLRADRQPEFTQVDIEMSFVDQNDVMSALEEVLADAFGRMGVEMPTPLRRMDYWEAMDTYGSDKPDTRYGMHLVDLTDIFANSKFKVFATAANEEGSVVKAINAKAPVPGHVPRSISSPAWPPRWRQGPGMDRLPRGRLHQQPHRQVLLGRGDGRSARAHGRRARRPCDVRRRPAPAL